MKTLTSKLISLFVLFVLPCTAIFSQTVHKDYFDGQIFLKLMDDVALTSALKQTEIDMDQISFIKNIKEKYELQSMNRIFHRIDNHKLQRTYLIKFDRAEEVESLIIVMEAEKTVDYAEKVPLYKISYNPNDPSYPGSQWFLPQIEAAGAWDLCQGDNINVCVAINDMGTDNTHQDLAANIFINPNEIANNGIDDDNNGYVDDVSGWDCVNNDNNPAPSGSDHGMHTSGIVSGVTDNGTGIASIGFGTGIIGVRVGTSTTLNDAYAGMIYVLESGFVDVMSMSYGGDGFSQTDQNIFDQLYAQGIVSVAAAGNDNSSSIFYPANYDHVISVASTTTGDAKSGFSNYGSWIDVSAPGSNIYSTLTNNSYGNMSGTSMACPLVAGLCGLMRSLNPDITVDDLIQCLYSSCDNIDGANPGYVGQLGAGRINARVALECVSQSMESPPVANFSADVLSTCDGIIQFTDHSMYPVTSWLWDFGDGNTSTAQDPGHTYIVANTYTVQLTVSNVFGSDTEIKTNYIDVIIPDAPVTTNGSGPAGSTITLYASGSGTLDWYDQLTGGILINTGISYTTPPIFQTTSYYVEDIIQDPEQNTGKLNQGTGGYFTGNDIRGLVFDVLNPMTLKSVKVYANSAGDRLIEVVDGVGSTNVLATATINIPAGESRIDLNFDLSPGTYYHIKVTDPSGNGGGDMVDLHRDNTGASYPYTIADLVSIKYSNTNDAQSDLEYYYFFYDWIVQEGPCYSIRSEVIAEITTGIESLNGCGPAIIPNPSNGQFILQFAENYEKPVMIKILSVNGKIIYKNNSITNNKESIEIDLKDQPKGLYFIQLIYQNSISNHKVIIN